METRVVFADEFSKDHIGHYYGQRRDFLEFVNETSRDYRRAVFGVFDMIATDSIAVLLGRHLGVDMLSLSALATIDNSSMSGLSFDVVYVTYVNGTRTSPDIGFGGLELYRPTISNIMRAVQHAVLLDLGNTDQDNIFLNSSAVNSTFDPNRAPGTIPPGSWVGSGWSTYYYGDIVPPYQTWAEMLRAGLPSNITLGGLTGLPLDSTIVASYLCPSYQLKPTSSLLASIFIGTATMFLSAWAAWSFVSAIVARRIRGPCKSGLGSGLGEAFSADLGP